MRDPMSKLPVPKQEFRTNQRSMPQIIVKVLRAVNNNTFITALLHVGVFCAVRTSEVLGLRWRSFCGDHFLIRDSAWKGKLLEDATKTGVKDESRYRRLLGKFCSAGVSSATMFARMP